MSLSNAPVGYPQKNTEGYDLFYPIGGNGLPAGKARVMFDSQTFEDVAEVKEYQRRLVAQPKDPVGVYPDGTGMFFPTDLSDNDTAYIRGELGPYGVATNGRQLSFDVMKGGAAEINHAITRGDRINPGSNKWPTDDVQPALVKEVARLTALNGKSKGVVRTDQFGNKML